MLLSSIETRPGAYQQLTTSPHWHELGDMNFFSVGTGQSTQNRVAAIPTSPDSLPDLDVEVKHHDRRDPSLFYLHTFMLDRNDQVIDLSHSKIVIARSGLEYPMPVTPVSLDTIFDWIQIAIRQHENRLKQHNQPGRRYYTPADIYFPHNLIEARFRPRLATIEMMDKR